MLDRIEIEQTVMEKFRIIFRTCWRYSFFLLLLFSSLLCFSQKVTTRAPDDIGMTENFDFYVFMLNNELRLSSAMSFTNDTIHISPYITNTPNKSLFRTVAGHELAHYYNFVLHGEIVKTDSSKQYVDPVNWEISPDLKRIVYKGGDGSSVNKAIVIKRATTLK